MTTLGILILLLCLLTANAQRGNFGYSEDFHRGSFSRGDNSNAVRNGNSEGYRGPGGPEGRRGPGDDLHPSLFPPPLPPFLHNTSEEGMREFFEIMGNDNLTKAELDIEMQSWAQKQGDEVLAVFEETETRRKEHEEKMRLEASEAVKNVAQLLEQIEAVRGNKDITRMQEREQIIDIIRETPRSLVLTLEAIEHSLRRSPPEFPPYHEQFGVNDGPFRGANGGFRTEEPDGFHREYEDVQDSNSGFNGMRNKPSGIFGIRGGSQYEGYGSEVNDDQANDGGK